MLTNTETGRLRCDRCGTDLADANGPMALEEGSENLLCIRCQGLQQGYDEGRLELVSKEARRWAFELVNATRDVDVARAQLLRDLDDADAERERLIAIGQPPHVDPERR